MTVPAWVSLVTLGVTDVERAASFYESLGWRRSSASAEGEVAFFATGTVVVALYRADLLAADAGRSGAEPPSFRGVSLAMNLPSEADVDAAVESARAAGATVPAPPQRTDWGGYSGYFLDPEGHAWEVAFNPGFRLRDDGAVELPD